jgi:vitamin B12 transporter
MENVDKLEKRGLELTLNHKLNNNVDIEASYSYVRAKNNKGNGFIRDINYIPNTYRVGIHYQDGKWDSNLWLRSGSGASLAESLSYDKDHAFLEDSYWTVDFSVTYKARKDLDIFIKGYNLFNEAYGEFAGAYKGSYNYPAQSRRFIVGAEYKF